MPMGQSLSDTENCPPLEQPKQHIDAKALCGVFSSGDSIKKPAAKRFQKDETFVIFDWDDTLLPSFWINQHGITLDESSMKQEDKDLLEETSALSKKLLKIASQHGKVIIITNAEEGWIELSCKKFLPSLEPDLQNYKIVSARSQFETSSARVLPASEWKRKAFEAEIKKFYGKSDKPKNVISLGDSIHEREAVLAATSKLADARCKSIKFLERPQVKLLHHQQRLILGCLAEILQVDGGLDLCIKVN